MTERISEQGLRKDVLRLQGLVTFARQTADKALARAREARYWAIGAVTLAVAVIVFVVAR